MKALAQQLPPYVADKRCVSGEPEGYDDDYDRRKKAVFEAKVADQAEHACHAAEREIEECREGDNECSSDKPALYHSVLSDDSSGFPLYCGEKTNACD
ncbi:uncharacterized protein MONOS_15847 [Monocercomonoides exilis]|uniref:uncharacterized protein n=1 Tax=Monocercomonoides exilis TaxID=2049356 RepID=UPI003559E2B3|nr:hypothetical protein MONOS_15847 [Monocercomonoides exilis]|eukprot:MONOS_15847.1-p1 / transcript=MONOS_15847.1 / gene=MONOS_15847 / organism=Monocercomonoides_exilis_PA203 / gene_product=unspecified product / transcript_product=unspecified product / location=Mono_scaffold01378:1236-1577(+) / protein_length=98 / sequence_SO=supercontig / SO=protein_coding / is_pseudo=false